MKISKQVNMYSTKVARKLPNLRPNLKYVLNAAAIQ